MDYAPLRKDAQTALPIAGDYWPGLYLNVGHGSRGLAYTPLSGELLAAQIAAEPQPVSRQLSRALNPARFLIDRKSTRLNSSHVASSYAVFCLQKKKSSPT